MAAVVVLTHFAATAVAHLHHPTPKASDLRCGISSSWELLGGCPRCLHSALHTGNFSGPWTNRQTLPRIDELGKHEHAAAASTFVPTLFGAGALTGEVTSPVLFRQRKMKHGQLVALTRPWFRAEKHFLQQAPAVLGWHRPDLFSPTATNEAPKTAGDEPLRDSRAADEVGSPRAAQYWKAMVQNLSTHHKAYYGTGSHTRIIAPLVGADRSGLNGDGTRAGISPRAPCTFPKDRTREAMAFWGGPSYQRACDGWLADFKRSTLQLPCVSPAGKHTNCWDVTSSLNLQVTGEPSREGAQHVLVQVEEYAKIFADDLAGVHGRSQKTLWLTEVAVASSDLGEILPFVEYLMDPVEGLRNRERFWYVEVVSWKHAHSINSKEHPTNPPPSVAGSSVAKKREEGLWVSSLFDAFGDLTPLGAAFFGACPRGLAVPRAAAASAAVSAAASAGGTPSTVAQDQPPPPLTPAPKPAAALPLQCGVATGFFAGCRSCALAALQTGRLSRWYNWGMAPFGFLDPKTPRKLRTEMYARFMPMHWGPKMLQPGEAPSKPMNMPGWHLSLLRSNAAEFSFFNEPDAYGPACDGLDATPANACQLGEFAPIRALGGVDAPESSPRASMFDPVTSAPLCCNLGANRLAPSHRAIGVGRPPRAAIRTHARTHARTQPSTRRA